MKRQNAGQVKQKQRECPPIDWSKVTPYDVIRATNCKTTMVRKREAYPSIRPRVSNCSNDQTMRWLAEAVKDTGCCRAFGTDADDDVVEVWKQSPNKDKLGFYGINTNIPTPDVHFYNKALKKSLDIANGVEEKKEKKPSAEDEKKKAEKKIPRGGGYTLNRCVLSKIVNAMPTVTRKLAAKNAHTWLQCPEPEHPEYPFLDDGDQAVPLQESLDMKPPEKKGKHGLRRHHKYCELQCGLPDNKCTYYEWMKYKQNPTPYDVAYKMEMAQEKVKPMAEPRNYDELYWYLMGSFQQCGPKKDCSCYLKCCFPKPKPKFVKGCGEFVLDRPREYSFGVICIYHSPIGKSRERALKSNHAQRILIKSHFVFIPMQGETE